MMDGPLAAVGLLGVEILILLWLIRRVSGRVERLEEVLRPKPFPFGPKDRTIPRVTFTGTGDLPVSIGVDALLWNGKPFPFATQGPFLIELSDDNAAIVTVRMAVAFVDHPIIDDAWLPADVTA